MKITVENHTTKITRVFNFDTLVCSVYEKEQDYGLEFFSSLKAMQKELEYCIESCLEFNFDYTVIHNKLFKNEN